MAESPSKNRLAAIRASLLATDTAVSKLSDDEVFEEMGISELAREGEQLVVGDLVAIVRCGLRRVFVSRKMFAEDSQKSPGEQNEIRERQIQKYYKFEIGDENLRGLVDAPHGGPIDDEINEKYEKLGISVLDQFTAQIAKIVKNWMIPKNSRAHVDTNQLPEDPQISHTQTVEGLIVAREPNLNAIRAQRDTVLKFLRANKNLDKSGCAREPFLYIAAHGKVDARGHDFEIAAKTVDGRAPLDPRLAFWFAEKLRERLVTHKIKNENGKMPTVNVKIFRGPYSGSAAIWRLRNGDGALGFYGFGENFHALQLEIGKFLRINFPEKVGQILQEILEEFTCEFSDHSAFDQKLKTFKSDFDEKLVKEKSEFWSVKKIHFDPKFLENEIGLPNSAIEELGLKRGDLVRVVGIKEPLKIVATLSLPIQKKTGKSFRLVAIYKNSLTGSLEISKIENEN